MAPSGVSPSFVAYTLAFALAATGCAIALGRARTLDDPATRRGLVALLLSSGGWAGLELGFLLAPTPGTAYAAYQGSLIVGLATVGAWLYFCSAYTGRSFHRDRTYRRLALGIYLAIVTLKLTNPVHGLYFTTAFVSSPFPHLGIRHGPVHWIVTGLSYALVAVGFFMLYELFLEADYDTAPLGVLVGVTGLPVLLDIVGFTTSLLIDINHEPLGVSVFVLGVLYFFEDRFLAVQLTDGVDEAVVYLDQADRIREFNGAAEAVFPALDGAVGESFDAVLPRAAGALGDDEPVVERVEDGESRYYLVSDTSFTLGQADIGRLVVFSEVTETERRRRELERHNQQLEGFAAAIRHELLNVIQIVRGRVAVAGEALDEGDVGGARESLSVASDANERMARIVADLADLARYGQTASRTRQIEFVDAAESALDAARTDGLALTVEGEGELEADPARLAELFGNAFEFAAHNGAASVTVSLREDGFEIRDDGEPPGRSDVEAFFEYGRAAPDSEAGMTLPNLRMLARVQGWDADVDTGYEDGFRIVVSEASVRPASGAARPS